MASLGQSSEVLYHVTSFLTGMPPSKYSTQHSRPTLVARAAEKETGTGVSVSVCECECLHGARGWGVLWLWEDLRSVCVHVRVCGGENSCAYLCVCVRVSLGGSAMRAVCVFPCGKRVQGLHMCLRVCRVSTVVCTRPLCGLGEAPCVCIYARACMRRCVSGRVCVCPHERVSSYVCASVYLCVFGGVVHAYLHVCLCACLCVVRVCTPNPSPGPARAHSGPAPGLSPSPALTAHRIWRQELSLTHYPIVQPINQQTGNTWL